MSHVPQWRGAVINTATLNTLRITAPDAVVYCRWAADAGMKLPAGDRAVEVTRMPSGLGFVARRRSGWIGAADPKRDGAADGR